MPYIIKSLVGTRRDPNRRGHRSPLVQRASARLHIGKRSIKAGKSCSISDTVFEKNKTQLEALAKAGVIELRKVGSSTNWQPEQIHAPKEEAVVEAAPVEAPVEEAVVEEAPVEEAAVAEEEAAPEEAPAEEEPVAEEPPKKEKPAPKKAEKVSEEKAPAKKRRQSRRRKKAEDGE